MYYRVDVFYHNGEHGKVYFGSLEDALSFGYYQADSIHVVTVYLLTCMLDGHYEVDQQIVSDLEDPDDLCFEVQGV